MRGLLIFLALSKSALINEESNRRNPLEVISCQHSREIINLQFQLFFSTLIISWTPLYELVSEQFSPKRESPLGEAGGIWGEDHRF